MKTLTTYIRVCMPLLIAFIAGCAQDEQSIAPQPSDEETNKTSSLSGYDIYVNHYSNHWPTYYNIEFSGQGGGVHFYARWKWYQGYGSRTVCILDSTCGVGIGDCLQEFDLPGVCAYRFGVDGPYQMEVTIGSYIDNPYTDYWTY
jgi:hypothetical protein